MRIAAIVVTVLVLLSQLLAAFFVNPVSALPGLLWNVLLLVGLLRTSSGAAFGGAAYCLAVCLAGWLIPNRSPMLWFETLLGIGGITVYLLAARALPKWDGRWWLWFVYPALVVVFASLFQPFVIPTAAMTPGIEAGDFVLVLTSGASGLNRGSLVVFRRANHNLTVKRIVGLPGDRIHLLHKNVILNGAPLHEPWVQHTTDYEDPYRDNFPGITNTTLDPKMTEQLNTVVKDGDFVVPPGEFFALGDNRDLSLDSRYDGTYPFREVIGKPVLIYFSAEPGKDAESIRLVLPVTRWKRIFQTLH